ncbi:ankyrin repeat-containing domain protein [Baffinella frigidus]|nr:ankyrin repeat-containing domain protein [Cryptophyta sp. CCMP2293]
MTPCSLPRQAPLLQAIFALPPPLLVVAGVHPRMQNVPALLQPLHLSAYSGHTECVRILIGLRADVNSQAGDSDTALHKACFQGHPAVTRLLLSAGASAEAMTPVRVESEPCSHGNAQCPGHRQVKEGRRTPLHYAVTHDFGRDQPGKPGGGVAGRVACVEELLSHGVDPNVGDAWNLTALHHACHRGFQEAVAVLQRHAGTDLNCQDGEDRRGDTPLIKAAYKGHVEIVQRLLSERASSGIDDLDAEGANPDIANRLGFTALHLASDQGHTDVVAALIQAGAKSLRDPRGMLAVQMATERGHAGVVALLQGAEEHRADATHHV